MYDNFLINLEADYIALWLEDRAGSKRLAGNNKEHDAWNVNVSFVYSF